MQHVAHDQPLADIGLKPAGGLELGKLFGFSNEKIIMGISRFAWDTAENPEDESD